MIKDEALKLALEYLESRDLAWNVQIALREALAQEQIDALGAVSKDVSPAITAIKEALREHAMREVQRLGQEIEQEPVADAYTFAEMRFVVCPNCGNKRCPKANDHRNACTNSNEVGQKGSSWEHVKPLAQPASEEDMKIYKTIAANYHKDLSTPPQRTWVDLTHEQIQKCYETTGHYQTLRPQDRFAVFELARAVEAELKEKNT